MDLPQNDSFPDFIVVGAMRSGTTTLYHMLRQHPEIGMSRMKETDYFVRTMNYPLGPKWYRNQFPGDFRIYGEVSPNYSKNDLFMGVPKRIADVAPKARIIFLARDPVKRFVSHYMFSWHMGLAQVTPDELLDSDNGRHMLQCSRYASQVRSYLEHFPREQVLLLDFDELKSDPQGLLNTVTDFLGVSRIEYEASGTRNERSEIAAMPSTIQRLWRSRMFRRLDPLISRGMRDTARKLLTRKKRAPDPVITADIRARAAELLKDDAAEFRQLSGLEFKSWSV